MRKTWKELEAENAALRELLGVIGETVLVPLGAVGHEQEEYELLRSRAVYISATAEENGPGGGTDIPGSAGLVQAHVRALREYAAERPVTYPVYGSKAARDGE